MDYFSDFRLAGGSWNGEGRVEVFYNGEWGTVCDDGWDMNDARVMCGELGYADAVSAPLYAYFGTGSGQIWLDNVNCAGSEDSIVNCQHNGWGSHNCNHNEDASVVCSSKSITQGQSWIMFIHLIYEDPLFFSSFSSLSVLLQLSRSYMKSRRKNLYDQIWYGLSYVKGLGVALFSRDKYQVVFKEGG